MNDQRNRRQTLTIRLTAEEKALLKRKAKKRRTSVTDYILLSALGEETAGDRAAKQLLEKLAAIGSLLESMQAEDCPADYFEVLQMQEQILKELCRLAKGAWR